MTQKSSIQARKSNVRWLIVALVLSFSTTGWAQSKPWEQADVKVKRIKPADLPSREESSFPSVLKSKNILPKPTTLEQRKSLGKKVEPMVVEIVAILPPPNSFQRNPTLVRGHATWVSAEENGANPVLVTTMHWLEGAQAIYVSPENLRTPNGPRDNLPRARNRSLGSLSAGGLVREILKKSDELVSLESIEIDMHRNLLTLVPGSSESKLQTPKRGLTFFDVQRQSPTYIYGYSPMLGPNPRAALFFPIDASEALSFYLQTDFPATLGAPLVTIDAELVAITAMRHPEEQARTLVVPPLALEKYVERVQGLRTSSLVEEVSEEEEK